MSKRLMRLLGVLLALSMVAAACGGSDDDVAETDTGGDTSSQPDDSNDGDGDDGAMDDDEAKQLVIGTILPVTGDLAFLGPAEIAGSELAIQDINAAGGVFGQDVVVVRGEVR